MSEDKRGFTLDMENYKVYHVEPCPKCGSEILAHFKDSPITRRTCCDKCDYSPEQGSMIFFRLRVESKDVKNHARVTKKMLQHWNNAVAKEAGREPVKVTTRITPKGKAVLETQKKKRR